MAIQFCDKCGKLLKIKGNVGACSCGFEKKVDALVIKEKTESHIQDIKIISGKNEFATFPHKCKKCGYDRAELIDLGAPVSDEAGVILLKCGRCGHTERQTSGSCHL